MKTNKVSPLVAATLFLLVLNGCSSARVAHDKAERDHVRAKTEPIVNEAAAAHAETAALSKKVRATSEALLAKADSLQEKQDAFLEDVAKNYTGEPAAAAANKARSARGDHEAIRAEIGVLLGQIEELSKQFAPEAINVRREALVDSEIAQYKEQTGKKRLRPEDEEIVSHRVTRRLNGELNDAARTVLASNQRLEVLYEKENAMLIEVKTWDKGKQLTSDLLNLEMAAYFATGKWTLLPLMESALMDDLSKVMKRIDRHVRAAVRELASDPLHRTIRVVIRLEGYADSQGYASLPETQWVQADVELSERRAKTVADLFTPVVMEHFESVQWYDMKVHEPTISHVGYGRTMPLIDYTGPGEGSSDVNRRLVTIQVLIYLE